MKLTYKILLGHIAAAVLVTILVIIGYSTGISRSEDVAFAFGIVCLGMGILSLGLGIIILITGNKEWGSGFLLGGAELLLISGISCGGAFALG